MWLWCTWCTANQWPTGHAGQNSLPINTHTQHANVMQYDIMFKTAANNKTLFQSITCYRKTANAKTAASIAHIMLVDILSPHSQLMLHHNSIKLVNQFIYLGSLVTKDNRIEKETKPRIVKAANATKRLDKAMFSLKPAMWEAHVELTEPLWGWYCTAPCTAHLSTVQHPSFWTWL